MSVETGESRSIPELIAAVTGDLANLVRKEGELARTEVSEKLHQASKASQGLSIGAALLLGGFLILLQAAVLALSKVMDPMWASIVVGLVVAVIGYVMVKGAIDKVKPAQLTPDRSVRQLNKDAQLVKEQVQ